ncbi:PqqD family protein [Candidatus Electrothrix sp.]|uniref:PqqD family protein n=1 Tax=Candidatus Electrothrix sp. TaxID=2170559 RepID=UPI004056677F
MKMSSEDMQKKIILEPNYLLERIANEITVYHPTLTTSLYLNETGALIWELCNGQRSTADIIDILTASYQENSQQIAGDVANVITLLLKNNIATLQE